MTVKCKTLQCCVQLEAPILVNYFIQATLMIVLDTETAWIGFVFCKLNCSVCQLITNCLKNNLYSGLLCSSISLSLLWETCRDSKCVMAGRLLAFKTCWKILWSMFASINEYSVSHTVIQHGNSVLSDDGRAA